MIKLKPNLLQSIPCEKLCSQNRQRDSILALRDLQLLYLQQTKVTITSNKTNKQTNKKTYVKIRA